MLVSIIIPVYNAEQYVERCIESVISQTYRHLEIILVDDCSPDTSMEKAKAYIEKSPKSRDLQFRYLKHEYNRGASAARNTGMGVASGEYIYFMDSDDEIIPECIEVFVSQTEGGNFDVVSGDVEVIDGENPLYAFKHRKCIFRSTHDIVKAYNNSEITLIPCNKLLRSNIVLKQVPFKEGQTYEDELWSFLLVNKVSTWKNIDQKTYKYYIRPNSLTTKKVTSKKYYSYYSLIESMANMLSEASIPLYDENFMYVQSKRISWMSAVLKSGITLREKWDLFWKFYNLPIGSKQSFVLGVISAHATNMIYPYRCFVSLQIRKLFQMNYNS